MCIRDRSGCDRLFLVSSPRIELDFGSPPTGQGRERDHAAAIDAARRAGVKHIYYTSLAFARPSKAGVMRAHIRTEEYLVGLADVRYTVIREGLYNESWPLYFGHHDVEGDERDVVVVAGDSPISWTAIADLGLANAHVLGADGEEWAGKTFYLSNTGEPRSLVDIASMVSRAKGKHVELKVVDRTEHEDFYIKQRGMPEGFIKWWASSYNALRKQECLIKDDTFGSILASRGRRPKRIEETVTEMVKAARD